MTANKYASDDKEWIVAIDLGAIYIVEGSKDSNTLKRVIDTFIIGERQNQAPSGGGSSQIIVEEEIVIE